jgi:hypothetical protein
MFVVNRNRLFIFLVALVLACGMPTTRQAVADSAPAVTEKQLGEWLSRLSDDRSSVREDAYEQLVKLHRSDLPNLRLAISHRPALSPEQQDLIRGIVEQVYIAEIPYAGDPNRGFLGVMFDDNQLILNTVTTGVEVRHRIPGLSASRYLQDGDTILSITGPGGTRELHSCQELGETIKAFNANESPTFKVLRRGRILNLTVVLDPIPLTFEGELTREESQLRLADFRNQRQTEADGYWNETFAPLLDPPAAHAASR